MADLADYEEEPGQRIQTQASGKLVGSEEYVEAAQRVQSDPYDHMSWTVVCEEVCGNRGGSATPPDTYKKFLSHFPRAARVWSDFSLWYEKQGDYKSAEDILEGVVDNVRSVKLWMQYLRIVARLTLGNAPSASTDASKGRRRVEAIFEKAVESVGWAWDSSPLWTMYLDFVKDWPGSAGLDPQKKISALKRIYIRAVQVPHEGVESMWEEFSNYEKHNWSHISGASAINVTEAVEKGGEALLQEVEPKYLNSRSMYKMRARLHARIDSLRFSTPPSRSSKDMEQLEQWNAVLRFESSSRSHWEGWITLEIQPTAAAIAITSAFQKNMCCHFEQCLAALGRHPEIWLAYAKFWAFDSASPTDVGGKAALVSAAQEIYARAIEEIPHSVLLRLASAELEETEGSPTAARRLYERAFRDLPGATTFSAYQRYLRRTMGMLAARRLFTEAVAERDDKKQGFPIYMAHARMELYSNQSPSVAIKVLELCRQAHPVACDSVAYLRVLVHALQQVGDLQSIQWSFATVLGNGGAASVLHAQHATDSGVNGVATLSRQAPETGVPVRGAASAASSTLTLEDQLTLWDLLLATEVVMGQSSLARLNSLRACRDGAVNALDVKRRASTVVGTTSTASAGSGTVVVPATVPGLFDIPSELLARQTLFATNINASGSASAAPGGYGGLVSYRSAGAALHLPEVDHGTFVRSLGRSALGDNSKHELASLNGGVDAVKAGVPPVLQNLLARLPTHTGPEPNVEQFLRNFKGVTLPPRPLEEEVTDLGSSIGVKRTIPGAEWLSGMNAGAGDDDIDYEMQEGDAGSVRDDVFRQRQRARRS